SEGDAGAATSSSSLPASRKTRDGPRAKLTSDASSPTFMSDIPLRLGKPRHRLAQSSRQKRSPRSGSQPAGKSAENETSGGLSESATVSCCAFPVSHDKTSLVPGDPSKP